jgi:branched-chain amino acid transport system ATP-binding protein
VSFTVGTGEVVALVGANGAGKTTALRTIGGLEPARAGSVRFAGVDITNRPAQRIVGLGLGPVPEGHRFHADGQGNTFAQRVGTPGGSVRVEGRKQ